MKGLRRASKANALASRPQQLRRVSAGLLVLGLLAVAGARWALMPHQPRDSRSALASTSADAGSLPVILSIQDEQAPFAGFRTPPEGVPRSVRRGLHASYGVNWLLGQRLPIKVGAQVWAIPGNGYICLLSLQSPGRSVPATTCDTNQHALGHGLATTFLSNARTRSPRATRVIFGVAPERAAEVIASTHRDAVSIPVRDGIFVRHDRATAPPDQLTLVARSSAGASMSTVARPGPASRPTTCLRGCADGLAPHR